MTPEIVALFLIFGVATCGTAGLYVGDLSGHPLAGALLGAFLGPFGVVAAAGLPPSEKVAARQRRQLAEEIAGVLSGRQAAQSNTPVDRKPTTVSQSAGRKREPRPQGMAVSEDAPAPEPVSEEVPAPEPYDGIREGFYVDPFDPTRERYWDGNQWDTETYPRERRTRVATPTSYPGMPPGWYTDPSNPGKDRYWLGDRWDDAKFGRSR